MGKIGEFCQRGEIVGRLVDVSSIYLILYIYDGVGSRRWSTSASTFRKYFSQVEAFNQNKKKGGLK